MPVPRPPLPGVKNLDKEAGDQATRNELYGLTYLLALEGILQARFGLLPAGIREEIQAISSVERLNELILRAATVSSLEEFSRQG